jgi:hypothetical protein
MSLLSSRMATLTIARAYQHAHHTHPNYTLDVTGGALNCSRRHHFRPLSHGLGYRTYSAFLGSGMSKSHALDYRSKASTREMEFFSRMTISSSSGEVNLASASELLQNVWLPTSQ